MTETLDDPVIAADSIYTRLGGAPAIRALVDGFYALMDELPEAYTVRRIHPDSLAGSADSLFKFLSGWFGGPTMYTDKKGHPRMRQRHAPYAVTPEAKDEWMLCMKQSLAETVADEPFRTQLQANFQALADHMVNTQY